MRKRHDQIARACEGITSLESMLVVCLAVVFLGLVSDLLIVIWGYALNDSAARDCARAAASTGNANSAYQAVLTALMTHRGDGVIVTNPICDPTAHPEDFAFVPNPTDNSFPYVAVTTRCQVSAPFSPDAFGEKLAIGKIAFDRTYVFPILGGSVSNSVLDGPMQGNEAGNGRGNKTGGG